MARPLVEAQAGAGWTRAAAFCGALVLWRSEWGAQMSVKDEAGRSEHRDRAARYGKPDGGGTDEATRVCMDMLTERYGIRSMLVSVPELAKALGISRSTIYAAVKEGRFMIPHRIVGQSPMFTTRDLVDWYLADQRSNIDQPARAARPAIARQSMSDGALCSQWVDDMVTKAAARVGRIGLEKSR